MPDTAETAYVYRHSLVRDAAYQLHLPNERAGLHAIVLAILGPKADADSRVPHTLGVLHDALPADEHRVLERRAGSVIREAVEQAYAKYESGRVLELAALLATLHEVEPRDEGMVRLLAGQALRLTGRADEAREALEALRGFGARHGLDEEARKAEVALAEMDGIAGDHAAAEQRFLRLLDAARASGDREVELRMLGNLAITHDLQGKYEQAHREYADALQQARDEDRKPEELVMLVNLGSCVQSLGRHEEALKLLAEALELATWIEDVRNQSYCYGWMGRSYYELGRLKEAGQHLRRGLKIAHAIGDRVLEGMWIGHLADVDERLGRGREAQNGYRKATDILNRGGAASVAKGWTEKLKKGRREEDG